MARRSPLATDRNLRIVIEMFRRLPPPLRIGLIVLVAFGAVGDFVLRHRPAADNATDNVPEAGGTAAADPPADGFLFCHWNVENLFDDHEDKRNSIDKPYDVGFAE